MANKTSVRPIFPTENFRAEPNSVKVATILCMKFPLSIGVEAKKSDSLLAEPGL